MFYFDREPTDFDVDLAEMITAEVIADFPEISNEKLATVYSNKYRKYKPLDSFKKGRWSMVVFFLMYCVNF